jgi:acetyltransferase EpsM
MVSSEKLTRVVLVGCGGLSQEVATYVKTISESFSADGKSLEISDLVDAGAGRFDDIDAILGYFPVRHQQYSEIADMHDKWFVICLGDPVAREREYRAIKELGGRLLTVIHPLACVAGSSTIEDGCIIAPFVFVGPYAHIGSNTVLNVRTTIGHDARIGASVVVSPHVDINGAVRVGKCTFFGSGVIAFPGVEIGSYSKIAAASVVKQSVGDGELVVGNPAKGRKMFAVPDPVG